MNATAPIRVLVVDDSALMRKLLSDIINTQPDMRAVGSAPDPIAAREMVRNLSPDVITLDVEMPKMDGLEFLSRLMRLKPTPVVMISTLTEEGADATLKALELGAVDFLAKPKLEAGANLRDYAGLIAEKIRSAARARPRARSAEPPVQRTPLIARGGTGFIAIGASTGGTEALRELLVRFPDDAPGVVITQHMPPGFTRRFAERLDSQCAPKVREAEGGEKVVPGTVFIAPGDRHLSVKRVGPEFVTVLQDTAPVNRHRPSVDVLFQSVADQAGAGALGVILTGMGRDGAAGMLAMHRAGAYTFAQDEASCVVFGMPREAIALGGVDEVVALDAMAEHLFNRLRTHPLQRQPQPHRSGALAK